MILGLLILLVISFLLILLWFWMQVVGSALYFSTALISAWLPLGKPRRPGNRT